MSASEAVMVAPEQCATAPKTLAAQHATSAKTSTTRLVLLAVLALAAATGAMFGAVVLGNQLTQELHPKGSSHLNSVTLVDSEDRAIATTAVESYVSLLDLPLLGTAELNKVDGITFRTHRGIEHRKVTGYTVTTETARVGDSEVKTPRLSLATSAPGATVEVSVRDNKAWLSEVEGGSSVVTAIDTGSQRRLADGGSCLESGACLYSRDELLRLDAASRRLEEGSFFARADVAAYQVELSGDVMESLENTLQATLDGTFSNGGHRLRLRFEEMAEGNRMLITNLTSGDSKLVTSEGTFVFSSSGRLLRCNERGFRDMANFDIEGVATALTFDAVEYGTTTAGFIPVEASSHECQRLTTKQANMSTPEALERFPLMATSFQQANQQDFQTVKDSFFKLESRRKLSASQGKIAAATERKVKAITARMDITNMIDLMTNPQSGRHMTMEELSHPNRMRVLSTARSRAHLPRKLFDKNYVTHFDLWLATRMADPTSIQGEYAWGMKPENDAFFADVTSADMGPELSMDLSGGFGIRKIFAEWSGWHYYGSVATPNCDGLSADECAAVTLFSSNKGTCAGGMNDLSGNTDNSIVSDFCEGADFDSGVGSGVLQETDFLYQDLKREFPFCTCYFDTYMQDKTQSWEQVQKKLGPLFCPGGMKKEELGLPVPPMGKPPRRLQEGRCDPREGRPETCCSDETLPCDVLTMECSRLTSELAMSYVDTLGYMGASCYQSGADMKLVDEDLVDDNPYIPTAATTMYASLNTVQKTRVVGYGGKGLPGGPPMGPPKWEGGPPEGKGGRGGMEKDPRRLKEKRGGMCDILKMECRGDPMCMCEMSRGECCDKGKEKGKEEKGGKEKDYLWKKFFAFNPELREGKERGTMYDGATGCILSESSEKKFVAYARCEGKKGCRYYDEPDKLDGRFFLGECPDPKKGGSVKPVLVSSGDKPKPEDPPAAPLPLPAAYAALLYKTRTDASVFDKEFAAAFQGTKMDEPSMMFYSLNRAPVYFSWKGADFVTTEGFALYTSETFPCVSSFVDEITDLQGQLTWITGHSLGGSAATLYAMTDYGNGATLVTFGALPTGHLGVSTATAFNFPCETYETNSCAGTGLPGAGAASSQATGVRYFHKFDPASGFYFNLMTLKHEVSGAYILYDTEDDDCTGVDTDLGTVAGNKVTPLTYFDPGVKKYDYDTDRDDLDDDEKSKLEFSLHKFLCTNYGVATHVASTDSSYYSYTTVVDPVPCKEALVSMAWAYIDSLPFVSSSVMPAEMWLPGETFLKCSADWIATVEAYTMTYFSSQLFEEHPVHTGLASDSQMVLFNFMFYAAFGLQWIHSAYPNYILVM